MTSPESELAPATEDAATLNARYGRTPGSKRRNISFAVVAAILVAAVFIAWAVWGGLFSSTAQYESNDAGTTIVSNREVAVSWEFSIAPGTPARCAVEALNANFAVVGWKIVDLPASGQHTRTLTQALLTTEPAVSGLIYRCWLV
jgi:hypothetical protein